MEQKDDDSSLFSSDKPKSFPWFYIPVMLGVVALIFIYKWFS